MRFHLRFVTRKMENMGDGHLRYRRIIDGVTNFGTTLSERVRENDQIGFNPTVKKGSSFMAKDRSRH